MRIEERSPPRVFETGVYENRILIKDCGSVHLEPDELVTFRTDSGCEHDVVRKEWGFYATQSLNSRLPDHRLHPVIVKNRQGRLYVFLVEAGKEPAFEAYLAEERLSVLHWLDSDEQCATFEAKLAGGTVAP